MKSYLRLFLLLAGLLTTISSAHALNTYEDAFSASKLNSKWEYVQEAGGVLKPKSGKLNLVVSTPHKKNDTGAHILLKKPRAKVTETWETQVTLENKASAGETWVGMVIGNADSLYKNHATIELQQFKGKYYVKAFQTVKGVESDGPSKKISAKKIYVRAGYNKSTRLITVSYRTSPTAKWTSFLTYSPFNDTKAQYRGNWKLDKTTGQFAVGIYAGSYKTVVKAGTVTADDFVIKN